MECLKLLNMVGWILMGLVMLGMVVEFIIKTAVYLKNRSKEKQ